MCMLTLYAQHWWQAEVQVYANMSINLLLSSWTVLEKPFRLLSGTFSWIYQRRDRRVALVKQFNCLFATTSSYAFTQPQLSAFRRVDVVKMTTCSGEAGCRSELFHKLLLTSVISVVPERDSVLLACERWNYMRWRPQNCGRNSQNSSTCNVYQIMQTCWIL